MKKKKEDKPMESICDRCSAVIEDVQPENCCKGCGGTFCQQCIAEHQC